MLLNVNDLSKFFGADPLFEGVSFSVEDRDKIGFIGSNGAGKSTLFKIILGQSQYDGGTITFGKDLKIGYMEQFLVKDENASVFDETLKVFDELINIENEINDINLEIEMGSGDALALADRQHVLNEKYDRLGGFVYKNKTRSTLIGLGFSEEDLNKKINVLSGGEATRVQLAKLLLSDCNLLMLDEPTNHLDIDSAKWLEDFLSSYNGAAIIISHDRYFLDKVTNKTMELENKVLTMYKGNYSTFKILKEEYIKTLENKYENTKREIERIEGIIEQQRRWNRERNIRTAEHKQKSIDRLKQDLVAPPDEEEHISFEFATNKSGGNDVAILENISVGFDGNTLLRNINMHIRRGERIFLIGPNGCGKTTLFKTILGINEPMGGTVKLGANVEPGYYDQRQDDLDKRKTVIDEVWDKYPKMTQTEIRNALAVFMFKGEDVFKDIDALSGGEKARVSLLKLMLSGSNFLMLDEPTNHLDIASKEALENAFENYSGTMFIISHDRYFINRLADKIYKLTPNGIEIYAGNYDYYESCMKEEKAPETKTVKVNDYKLKKEYEARLRKLRNDITKCENETEKIELENAGLEERLLDPEISGDYTKILEITKEIDANKQKLDELFEKWESLNNELEREENANI